MFVLIWCFVLVLVGFYSPIFGKFVFWGLPCLKFVVFGLSGCFGVDCFGIAFGFGFAELL